MKTKFILTAMCLPLAFAACTNEEVFVENNQSALPVVDLKVAATYGADGAESRMVNNNGKFLWEGTDVLGAVLNAGGSIYSNNKFVNTLAEANAQADFTTEATTVVGSYVFYYPYNSALTKDLSKGITYSVTEPQLYDPYGDLMMANNFMISPNVKVDGNEPGELSLPLTMRSIYGFGKLNIEFPEAGFISAPNAGNVSSVKIQKIIIAYDSNVESKGNILVNSQYYPTVNLTAANLKSLREGQDEKYKGKTNEELTTILFKEADDKLVAMNEDYNQGTIYDWTGSVASSTATTNVSISCITEEYPMGVEVSKTQPFSTRVLLPTTDNDGENVTVTVYTDKGVITYTESAARIKANHTVNLANPNRNSTKDDKFVLGTLSPVGSSITVISEQDFIASMAALANETAVNVTLSGDFVLTPAAINAIPSGLKVTFANAVKLNGDMTLKNIKFNGLTIKGGNVNISDKVEFTTGSTITVEAGSLNVSQNEGATKVGATSSTTIVKSGAVLNIADGVFFESDIKIAGGTLNLGVAASRAAAPKGIQSYFKGSEGLAGVVNVNVPFKIMNNGDVTLGSASSTNGLVTLNVNANITGAAKLTLAKTVTLNNNANVAELKANAGTINNYATLSVTTNSGTINNNADAIAGEGTLTVTTNSGTINTVKDSQTNVSSNTGKIFYAEGAFINGAGEGSQAEEGNVIFTMDTDMTANQLMKKFYNTRCTSLLVKNATLTVEEDTDLSKLAAMKSVSLNGATVVANDTIGFNHVPMYIENHVKITGEAPVVFAEGVHDILTVKKNSIFETEVIVAGLSNIDLQTGTAATDKQGKVVARTNIYGTFVGAFTNVNWVGVSYTQKTIAELIGAN